MNLTNKEYNLINLITNRAKINWFEIRTYDNGFDYVYDNEENETLTLVDGLLLLDDCLTDLEDYYLTNEEIEMYGNLMCHVRNYDRLITLLHNALTVIEDGNLCGRTLKGTEIQDEINITDEEYDYIMSETPNEDDDCFVEEDTKNTPAERRKIDDENSDAH